MANLEIPITKAGGATISVDTSSLPDDMYTLAMQEGLKVLLNAKMSKITVAKLEGEALAEAQAAAMAKAQENFADLMASRITKGRRSAAKTAIPREVMTEALRLAKAVVKDEIRAAGMRPSLVPASEITAAAKQLVADDPSFIDKAREAIESRATLTKLPEGAEAKTVARQRLASLGLSGEDSKLVAKAEKAKAEKKASAKATISAKQAGKVAPRKRPESHTAH